MDRLTRAILIEMFRVAVFLWGMIERFSMKCINIGWADVLLGTEDTQDILLKCTPNHGGARSSSTFNQLLYFSYP